MLKGYIYSFLYSIIIAISYISVDVLSSVYNMYFLLLCISIISLTFYTSITVKSINQTYLAIKNDFILWFIMSSYITITWVTSYYAVIYGSPRLMLLTLFLIMGIIGSIYKKHILSSILTFILLFLTYLLLPEVNILSFSMTFVCGISSFYFLKLSKVFANRNNLTTTQILSIRLYPLIVFSTIMLIYSVNNGSTILIIYISLFKILVSIILLAIFNMILPNFLSQKSVLLIGAEKFSFIASITPFMVFVLQGLIQNTWEIRVLIICVVSFLILNLKLIEKNGG